MKAIGTITLTTEVLGSRSPEGIIQQPKEKVKDFASRRLSSTQKMFQSKGSGSRGVGNVTPEGIRVNPNEKIASITARRLAAKKDIARGNTGTRT